MSSPTAKDDISIPAGEGLPKRGEIFDGKYRVEGVLGVGGMGVVFAARHLRLDERVAIKILLPQWAKDPAIVSRFMQEGRSSLKVRSEHVVRVLDDGSINGQPYLVLEYLDGKDFEALVAEDGPMPIAQAVTLLLQACEALAEAHVAGVIHRDLRPANLFLTHRADGSPCVKVLDFGISKVTLTGARLSGFQAQGTLPTLVMGSPHYMSPEQMQSPRDVDERSDIWSLGAVLHELLAGTPPFQAPTITELYARILRDPAPPLALSRADVSPALEAIVLRCLEKDPSNRYPNVAVFARALASFGAVEAQASAERISRIIEGGIGPQTVRRELAPPDAPATSVRPRLDNARQLLDGEPVPMRRPVAGYALFAVIVLAVGSGIGWKVVTQTRANDRAEAERPQAVLAAPPSPSASSVPPVPSSLPTSVASTTGAVTPGPVASAQPTAPTPAPEPPTVASAGKPSSSKHVASPHPHHARHTASQAPLPSFPIPSSTEGDNPYAGSSPGPGPGPVPEPVAEPSSPPAAPTPAASPTPSAPAAASADPNQLFDDRK